jgi:signal transduction histidine kinase
MVTVTGNAVFYSDSKRLELGLYIVKETVDKILGTILVKSQFDIGSTFEITIPSLRLNGLIKGMIRS